jgi:3',5'-cyclic-AMP phosphodiesterase
MSIKHLTWITDPHLEFCSVHDRMALYESINKSSGQAVLITGDISAGRHRFGHYCELAREVKKPIYFVLGNHDRYGTTFADAEAVCACACKENANLLRLDGSQIIFLSELVGLIGVNGWADGLGGLGPETKARINDFSYIKDFAKLPENEVFLRMAELARGYADAVETSLRQGLEEFKTVIVATHVPPFEAAAWHEGKPTSPDYQPFFSSPTLGKMIKAVSAENPKKRILVLCGHTHEVGVCEEGPIFVATGAADHGKPRLAATINVDRISQTVLCLSTWSLIAL